MGSTRTTSFPGNRHFVNAPFSSNQSIAGSARTVSVRAFTLDELLAVIAIIGILAAVEMPALKGIGSSNVSIAATRQLLDDVAFARGRSLSSRAEVDLVFVPPEITNWMNSLTFETAYTDQERRAFTNLALGQYTTYAVYSSRNVGDQPGADFPRYWTEWKSLPAGSFIPTNKFAYRTLDANFVNGVRPFATNAFPFPFATSPKVMLPYVGFDYQGRIALERDEILPLALGSIFYPRGPNGILRAPFVADVAQSPASNSVTLYNHVYIEWLTGRARVERQELQ